MAKIIAITNQKGGVGKTTTCVNLAASIAVTKRKVLVIDMDPQGNATTGSGVEKYSIKKTLADVVLEDCPIDEAVVTAKAAGYDLLPANDNLTTLEVNILDLPHRERKLYFALEPLQDKYDFIFLDCPPSLSILTVNGLVAADGVIIPMQCEYYALEGVSALVKTINAVRRSANPKLQIVGLLRTMYDNRSKLAQAVTAELEEHFANKVFKTVIPRNVRLAEAPSHGKPILQYDKHSRGAAAYIALAGELLKRYRDEERLAKQAASAV